MIYEIEHIKKENPTASFNKYDGIVTEDDIILGLHETTALIEQYYNGFDNLNPNAKDYINSAYFGDYELAYNNI